MQSCNTTCSESQVKKPFSIDYQRYYFFPHGPNNVREEGDGQTHSVEWREGAGSHFTPEKQPLVRFLLHIEEVSLFDEGGTVG